MYNGKEREKVHFMKRWLSILFSKTGAVLFACVLVGIVIGLGSYTFLYAEGLSYFSNDPRACVNCHIMRDQYDSWQKASHHAVATCNDCHTPHSFVAKYWTKAENGFWHSKGFTLQDFHEPIRIRPRNARVLRANCIACHRELVSEIAEHPGGHGSKASDCLHCHVSSGHGPRP
jgi:cytochrome c nitrite reductase small subunit